MTTPPRPWTATCRGDYMHLIVANTKAANHGFCPKCWKKEQRLTDEAIARATAVLVAHESKEKP